MHQRPSWRRGQADITDLRLTLSTQLMQINPVTAAERLVVQTATDAATQAARVATFPIPRAVLLDLSRALGGGGMTKASTGLSVFGTPAAVGTAAAGFARGGGVVGTVESIVQDGVVTATRLVPASIEAATGVIISTINVPLQTGLATARVFLNVGTAVLTLNPATVLNTAALGAVRTAGVVEQTTIGTPALKFNSAQRGDRVYRIGDFVAAVEDRRKDARGPAQP